MKRSAWLILALCGWVATAATHDVTQKNKQFSETQVTIRVGESIRFLNRDTVTHHLFTSGHGFSFNFLQPEDQEKTVQFPVQGDYEVRCAIHPNMRLTVHVVP